MDDDCQDLAGARLLSASAHALRNHVATVRSIVRLVDDEEVAGALDEASRAIQVTLERAVVLARVDLGERPAGVQLDALELLEFAERRARREGASPVAMPAPAAGDGVLVEVPGAWAERLVADLLHHAVGTVTMEVTAQHVNIGVPMREPVTAPLDDGLVELARSCGGSLEWSDSRAVLCLARATSVNAE